MYGTIIASRPAFGGYTPVRTLEEMEFLVKEAEVITGIRGRVFVACGADRLPYRIELRPAGYALARLDESGRTQGTIDLLPESLHSHAVGHALRTGGLFTPVVRR